MTEPKKKPRAAGDTARGAGGLHLDGCRQPGIYRTGGVVATVLRTIHDEAGSFQGLEVAR
jgi:hypothetical protein